MLIYVQEGDEYEDDLLTVSDPLNQVLNLLPTCQRNVVKDYDYLVCSFSSFSSLLQINLAKYLVDFFMNLYQNDRQNFDNLFKVFFIQVNQFGAFYSSSCCFGFFN